MKRYLLWLCLFLLISIQINGQQKSRQEIYKQYKQQKSPSQIDGQQLPLKQTVDQEKIQSLEKRVQILEKIIIEQNEKPAHEQETEQYSLVWEEGLRFKTEDEAFNIGIGGRVFVDFGFPHEARQIRANLGNIADYAEFRSARIDIEGLIYRRYLFKGEFEFGAKLERANGQQVIFKDVYVGINKLFFNGTLLTGHLKEPFGLEHMTSVRFITFMEPASINALAPERSIGIRYNGYDSSERFTVSVGSFYSTAQSPPRIEIGSGSYAYTMRITALPYYSTFSFFKENSVMLFHVGIDYSLRRPSGTTLQFSSHPESNVNSNFVDTGQIAGVDLEHKFAAESALVIGPFSLQSEIMLSWPHIGNAFQQFFGYYVYFSVFLTGEHRNYIRSEGSFGRVKINRSLSWGKGGCGCKFLNLKKCCFGALELAVRYSSLDISDGVRGGRIDDLTAGINWYLNPNMRIMFNYVHSNTKGHPQLAGFGSLDASIFMVRTQVDF